MKITLRPKLAGDDSQDVVLADGADRAADNVRGPASGSVSVSIRDQVFQAIRATNARLIGRGNRIGTYSFGSSRLFASLADAGRFLLTHGMTCPAEGCLFFEFDSGDLVVLFGCTLRTIGQMEQVGVTIKGRYAVAYGDSDEVVAASLQTAINAYYGYVIELALNCGGSAASPFTADAHYPTGTNVSTTENSIGNISSQRPEAVYQACRWSSAAFTYEIPHLPDNTYTVKLHFCESWLDNVGDRVFNVAAAGTTVLEDFDILEAVGGPKNMAHVEEFDVAVTGGSLALLFTPVIGDPLIHGIEIAPKET